MNRDIAAFLLIAVLTGLLATLSILLRLNGYAFGDVGLARLDGLASSVTFIPLAALYAFSAALIMILPLRAAGYVHAQAATPIFFATIVLLATITGLQVARFGFGERGALRVLVDWQFIFAAGLLASHLFLDSLRRSTLLRTLAFVGFVAAMLACLYWIFRF